MSFSTACPTCGADGYLYVVFAKVTLDGVPLTSDGFSFTDAKQVHTEDELIECSSCGRVFDLAEVTL